MATAKFISKDQNWQEESTTYWFQITGLHEGTGRKFDGETFGICESGSGSRVLDCDGCPITFGDGEEIAVRNTAIITDEMRTA